MRLYAPLHLREYEFDGRSTPSGSLCGTFEIQIRFHAGRGCHWLDTDWWTRHGLRHAHWVVSRGGRSRRFTHDGGHHRHRVRYALIALVHADDSCLLEGRIILVHSRSTLGAVPPAAERNRPADRRPAVGPAPNVDTAAPCKLKFCANTGVVSHDRLGDGLPDGCARARIERFEIEMRANREVQGTVVTESQENHGISLRLSGANGDLLCWYR